MVMADDGKEALRKSTSSMLRAVLVSARDGLPLNRVEKEYREVTMQPLPYLDLGYTSIVDLLKNLPDVARIESLPDGRVLVKAIPSKEDAHVAKLVSGQKKKKLKRSTLPTRRAASAFKNRPVQKYSTPRFLPVHGQRISWTKSFSDAVNSTTRNAAGRLSYVGTPWRNYPLTNLNPLMNLNPGRSGQGVLAQTRHMPPRMVKLQQQKQQSQQSEPAFKNFTIGFNTDQGSDKRTVVYNEVLSPEQRQRVKDNVINMLDKSPNGLWDFILKTKYRNLYKEEPPQNLFGIITAEMGDRVLINEPIPGKVILSLQKETSAVNPRSSQSSPGTLQQSSPNNVDDAVFTDENSNNTNQNDSTPGYTVVESVNGKFWKNRLVIICHVDNLSRFYIQDRDSYVKLGELSDVMQEFYNDPRNSSHKLLTPRIGMYCCGQYTEDDLWCRAKILSIQYDKEDSGTNVSSTRASSNSPKHSQNQKIKYCRVFYVDYGNQEQLPLDRIRKLNKDFTELTAQAVLCQLASILPSEGENWNEEEVEYFRNLTEEKVFRCQVSHQEGNSLSIDLISEDDKSVCDQVVRTGNAVYAPDSPVESKGRKIRNGHTSPILQRLGSLSLDSSENPPAQFVELPDDPYVDVFVSYINTISDFSVIIDGQNHYERLETLEKSMLEYYSDPSQVHPQIISSGEFYAAYSMDGWYRCQATNRSGDKVDVNFVDHGDKSTVPIQEVRTLPPAFRRLPFQAISCALHNISDDNNNEINEKFKELANGKFFVASIVERNSKLFVELLETSSDEDKSINNELLLMKPESESLKPSLLEAKENIRMEAYLVHISDTGVLHLQIPGPGYDQVEKIMEQAAEKFSKRSKAADFVKTPEVGTLCFAKASDNVSWYRAEIVRIMQEERKVELEFVDYGDREIVPKTSLRDLSVVSSTAATIPYQVVKCELADWPSDQKVAWKNGLDEQLMEQVDERIVWVQTVKDATKNALATVHLYRTRDDGSIVERTVTDELLESLETNSDQLSEKSAGSDVRAKLTEIPSDLDQSSPEPSFDGSSASSADKNGRGLQTLRSVPYDEKLGNGAQSFSGRGSPPQYFYQTSVNSELVTEERKQSVSSTVTEELDDELYHLIPDLVFDDHWVDVVVFIAKNPWKFAIQPLDAGPAICDMHKEMKKYYENSEPDSAPPMKQYLYAVYRSEDDTWYRGIVRSTGMDDQVCVEYVDYGDLELVPVTRIRRLSHQFCTLPFQVIPAKLAAIKPKSKQWPKPASRRFCELVEGKVLVARIEEKYLTFEKLRRDPVRLRLYDTSDPEVDLVIADKMIQDGHATVDSSYYSS